MNIKRHIYLKPNVYFTNGVRYGTILDCTAHQLYRLNFQDKEKLKDWLYNGKDLDPNDQLIHNLDKCGLITEIPVTKENMKYDFNKLNIVWLELRKACNLECIHCYNSSNPCAENKKFPLSFDEWKNIITQLVPYKPKTIVFIGGEPLLFKDICDLIIFTRKELENTNLVLYSNLTLLKDYMIQVLKENNVKVVTSLYADNAEIHDKITRKNGSFEKTVSSIKQLKDNGISVTANMVVMNLNEELIQNTENFIFKITGNRTKSDVIRCTDSSLKYLEPKTTSIHNAHFIDSTKKLTLITKQSYLKCIIGNSCWQHKINITFDGYILPCIMHCQNSCDMSVRSNTLEYILDNNIIPRYWKLSKDKINVCKDCEYRYVCFDCRPLADSLNTRGTNCLYNPYLGRWNVKKSMLENYLSAPKVEAVENNSEIAFVFSCPGRIELEKNSLCSGTTGKNFELLLQALNSTEPAIFPFSDRKKYYITNASNRVHYKKLTGRSEPLKSEISLPENLYRLKSELERRKIVICMGKMAQNAVSKINLPSNITIIKSEHLSNSGLSHLNQKSTDKKIYDIANQIIKECKNCKI